MEHCIFLNEHLASLLSKKYDLTPEETPELERDKLCSKTLGYSPANIHGKLIFVHLLPKPTSSKKNRTTCKQNC